MPRSTYTIDPNAHLPAFLLRIYDAAEEFHGDPSIRGFTAGGYGRELSMSVDDFIPKQITTGFSSHIRAQSYVLPPPHFCLYTSNTTTTHRPWISTSTSWLWVLFECERRFAHHSKQPSNLRIAFISRAVLDRENIHYEDVSDPSYHALARHAGEVLVHDKIPAKAVFETLSYLDVRKSHLSSITPFLSKRQALSFPDLYRQDLPAGSTKGQSYRSVFEKLWCRLPGEEPVDMARYMGQVARQHWVRLLATLAPTAVLTSSFQLFLPPAPFFYRSEYTAIKKAFREGFYVPTARRMCDSSSSSSEDENESGSGTDRGDDSDSDDTSFELLAPPPVKSTPKPTPQVSPPAPVQPSVSSKPIVSAAPAAACVSVPPSAPVSVSVSAPAPAPSPSPSPASIANPVLILSPNPTIMLLPSNPAPVSSPVAAPAAAATKTTTTTTSFFDAVRSWVPAWLWSRS